MAAIDTLVTAPEKKVGDGSDLPLQRVSLYKNSVAFYTRTGRAEGDQMITLSFPEQDAERVVKTLKINDYDSGFVTVQYHDTADDTDLQGNFFEQIGVRDYVSILNSLRGIQVLVRMKNSEELMGVCVGTSQIRDPSLEKETCTVHVLNDRSEILGCAVHNIVSFQILDSKVANDFDYYVRGVPMTKQERRKKITLNCEGSGSRRIEASYIGPGFQWSAQYRLLFSERHNPYSGEYTWQFLDNEYRWAPFDAEDQEKLETALNEQTELVELNDGLRTVNVIARVQKNNESNRIRMIRRRAAGEDVWVSNEGYRISQVQGDSWVDCKDHKFTYVDSDPVSDYVYLQSDEDGQHYTITSRNMQRDDGTVLHSGSWASRSTEQCTLQCLASIKNPTTEDWNEVELCLVSGNIQFVGDQQMAPQPVRKNREQDRMLQANMLMQQAESFQHASKKKSARIWGFNRQKESAQIVRDASYQMMPQMALMDESDSEDEYLGVGGAAPSAPKMNQTDVANARDEDMTTFTVRKPITLQKNRAALVEMFECDLVDARKLIVIGLSGVQTNNYSKTTLECKNAVFFTNTTGHRLETGLCSAINNDSGVYMGEGHLGSKKDGISIITYADDNTLRVTGKQKEDKVYYEGGTLELLTITGNTTTRVDECVQIRVKAKRKVTTDYHIHNSSRRTYPFMILYHFGIKGEIVEPRANYITFGHSEQHADKHRFATSVLPLSKKTLKVVEQEDSTNTMHVTNVNELSLTNWVEGGLITAAQRKRIETRKANFYPKQSSCAIL